MPRPKPRKAPIRKKAVKARTARPTGEAAPPEAHDLLPFPIAGIGASAGGIEAVIQLLRALPADTGMAYFLIQHLDPTHASMLPEILSRATSMPVAEARTASVIQPNRVYVIPPGADLTISGGEMHVTRRREPPGQHRPIDLFLRTLAQDQGHQSIGIILSGSATDGTLGIAEIKGAGGITFAQDGTAQHDSMPRSAIATGCVDFVLPPDKIAAELARIARHPYVKPVAQEAPVLLPQFNFTAVLDVLQKATGVDFTHYKCNTMLRRITRRMLLLRLDSPEHYIEYLEHHPAEVEALFQDVLIHVTSFFRNPESYDLLKKEVFPELVKERPRSETVRFWVLGCSTGEEAYSLAIAYAEFAESAALSIPLQIFATDLNGQTIEKARSGIYSRAIAHDVSPERLRRYFVESESGYQVRKSIRDACVFARHNVLSEPPFSRIDLVSCRNLLIYLGQDMQQRVIPILHYALHARGFLWLGSSETIGSYRDLFDMKDARHKVYRKRQGVSRLAPLAPLVRDFQPERKRGQPVTANFREAPLPGIDVQKEADRVLIARYAPASVLVNPDHDILLFRGDTGRYLTPAPGRASLNLLKMLREGLLVPVRDALQKAGKGDVPVRKQGLSVRSNGGYTETSIEVIPVRTGSLTETFFLVLFDQGAAAEARAGAGGRERKTPVKGAVQKPEQELNRLTEELAATREYLQSVIEQQEAANEELQSANEEVQSANEELQSINEELETSKEEIQSSNEELATVNEELDFRNQELTLTNNDLLNLLASVEIAIVMLGANLRIRRFTPAAEKMLSLIPSDVGRPIRDLNLNLSIPDFERHLEEVIETATPREFEILDKQDRWHSLRLYPYRTLENKIEGVVVILVDIDNLKRSRLSGDSGAA